MPTGLTSCSCCQHFQAVFRQCNSQWGGVCAGLTEPAALLCRVQCRRVWRGAFGNLLSGKDPRKPFVDAFADEQLLGFYKYYRM